MSVTDDNRETVELEMDDWFQGPMELDNASRDQVAVYALAREAWLETP